MTVAPEVCAVALVPFAPRTQPVSVFVDLPEYVMDSVSITIVPDAVKDAADVNVMEVAELLIVPFNVVVTEPDVVPPQLPAPQPVATV